MPDSMRLIKVYLSYIGRDVDDELENLSVNIWPVLRRRLDEKGYALKVIDPRRGLAEDQLTNAQFIEYALQTLEHNQAIFMGLYGGFRTPWRPPFYPVGFISRRPWLPPVGELNIAELEALSGIFLQAHKQIPSLICARGPGFEHNQAISHEDVMVKSLLLRQNDQLKNLSDLIGEKDSPKILRPNYSLTWRGLVFPTQNAREDLSDEAFTALTTAVKDVDYIDLKTAAGLPPEARRWLGQYGWPRFSGFEDFNRELIKALWQAFASREPALLSGPSFGLSASDNGAHSVTSRSSRVISLMSDRNAMTRARSDAIMKVSKRLSPLENVQGPFVVTGQPGDDLSSFLAGVSHHWLRLVPGGTALAWLADPLLDWMGPEAALISLIKKIAAWLKLPQDNEFLDPALSVSAALAGILAGVPPDKALLLVTEFSGDPDGINYLAALKDIFKTWPPRLRLLAGGPSEWARTESISGLEHFSIGPMPPAEIKEILCLLPPLASTTYDQELEDTFISRPVFAHPEHLVTAVRHLSSPRYTPFERLIKISAWPGPKAEAWRQIWLDELDYLTAANPSDHYKVFFIALALIPGGLKVKPLEHILDKWAKVAGRDDLLAGLDLSTEIDLFVERFSNCVNMVGSLISLTDQMLAEVIIRQWLGDQETKAWWLKFLADHLVEEPPDLRISAQTILFLNINGFKGRLLNYLASPANFCAAMRYDPWEFKAVWQDLGLSPSAIYWEGFKKQYDEEQIFSHIELGRRLTLSDLGRPEAAFKSVAAYNEPDLVMLLNVARFGLRVATGPDDVELALWALGLYGAASEKTPAVTWLAGDLVDTLRKETTGYAS